MGGGLYIPAVGATVIILIILAGIKPPEGRFLGIRQRRILMIFADRDALSLPKLHDALGAGSARVQRFILRQTRGDSDRAHSERTGTRGLK